MHLEAVKAAIALDLEKFKREWKRAGLSAPPGERMYEITMHKIRATSFMADPKDREASKKWLTDRGFSSTLAQMIKPSWKLN